MSKLRNAVQLFVILAALSGFIPTVFAQVACDPAKGQAVYPAKPGTCYYIAEAVLWVDGPVKTTVDITNTTSGEVQYDLIPSGSFFAATGNSVNIWSSIGTGVPGTGNVTTTLEAGKPNTITFWGTSKPVCDDNGKCQPSGDQVITQLYIRVVGTPDLLDQQKDSAIVTTTAYAPDVVTVALPWSFFATSVRRNNIRAQSMGNFTETRPGPEPTLKDKHNLVLITNTGVAQKMQVSILDNNNTVITQTVTREVAHDELLLESLPQMFGASMLPGGVDVFQGRVSVVGMGGDPVSTQDVELVGAPYALSTVPTWAGGQ